MTTSINNLLYLAGDDYYSNTDTESTYFFEMWRVGKERSSKQPESKPYQMLKLSRKTLEYYYN